MNPARKTTNINNRNKMFVKNPNKGLSYGMKKFSIKHGFALLYSVIFIAASLTISAGLANLILNQVRFSGLGRDSQAAFYAADTGVECALYWDLQIGAFSSPDLVDISCAREVSQVGGSTNSFSRTLANGACVNVNVAKTVDQTTITALGRFPCDGRRVERGLEVRY